MQTDQKVFLGLVGVAMIAASVYLGLQMLTPGNMEIEDPSTPPPVTTPVENPQQPSVPVQPKEKEYASLALKRLELAEKNSQIQGFEDGIFRPRNG